MRWLALTLALFALTDPALAQRSSTASGAPTALASRQAEPGSARDEADLRDLEREHAQAILDQDFEALARLWNEDFHVNNPMNLVVPNRASVLDVFRRGLAHYTAYEMQIEQVYIVGDIATVMGGETVRPTGNAPRAGETMQRRFSHTWVRSGGTWSLLARHSNNVAP